MTIATLFAGCQSNEEKAAELIKEELSKVLYDFDSYQPIETTVIEAKASLYNDSACWEKGAVLAYGMKQAMEYVDKSKEAKNHMDIWGPPTYYSSSYSDSQYEKYKGEYVEALEKILKAHKVCKGIALEIKKMAADLDTSKVIGWEVNHRFRCKTKGGYSSIGDYRYIIDEDFKNVLLREDKDNEDDKMTREVLGTINSDYWNDNE